MRVVLGLAAGVIIGFWLDDPADRVTTETVTEEVEVPGPTVVRYERPELPTVCLTYIDRYLGQNESIAGYTDAISGQLVNFNDALQAIHSGDIGEVNRTITVQHEVQSGATGYLQQLINDQPELNTLQERCERELEELR